MIGTGGVRMIPEKQKNSQHSLHIGGISTKV